LVLKIKMLFNCFLTTKISFANSIGDLAKKVGADQEKILDAIGSDNRIGNKFLKYGYGYGGPCLPRDNRALAAYAQDNDIDLLISKATDETNKQHLNFQYQEFSENNKKQIVFDGIAYKKGTVILEESQPLLLAKKLAENGFDILIKDSQDVIEQLKQNYGNLFKLQVI